MLSLAPGQPLDTRGQWMAAQEPLPAEEREQVLRWNRVAEAPPRIQTHLPAKWTNDLHSVASKTAPSLLHRCWHQGLAGPFVGVGVSQNRRPLQERPVCPQSRAPTFGTVGTGSVYTPGHPGLRFLHTRLGARAQGLPA